ncbi:SEC-C domain-containing protein [Vibrio parahaemolyticus]|nr:SEC-C domain-containing protein [Vibrio parahaemolyticus]
MNLGRNELCWCGSGVKYKKCHLNRQEQSSIHQGDILKKCNKFYSKKYCSVGSQLRSECSNRIIKAHSVSKSSSLKSISVDGHVYTMFKESVRNVSDFLDFSPKKIGINSASTFTGFCSKHDKELFSPIEDYEFTSTSNNLFLVAYRTLCREIFVKKSVKSNQLELIKSLDKGRDLQEQCIIQSFSHYFDESNDLTMLDLDRMKARYDTIFQNEKFEELQHLVLEFEHPMEVMGCGVVGQSVGFDGQWLQEYTENPDDFPDYLNLNSFSNGNNGIVTLSWLKEHSTSNLMFANQLISHDSIINAIVGFLFARYENLYMHPKWWDSLATDQRSGLMSIFSITSLSMPSSADNILTNLPCVSENKLIKFNFVNVT